MTNPESTIEYMLGRIEQKIDSFTENHKDHESRISNLEDWKTSVVAKATGAAAVLGFVGAGAWKLLEHFTR